MTMTEQRIFSGEEIYKALKKEWQELLDEEFFLSLLSLSPALTLQEIEEQILDFLLLMLEQNISMNLSAIKDPHDVMRLHILDSFTILPFLDAELAKETEAGFRFLDLGTGAGFPGVPIKLVRPGLHVYLVDALAKRLRFIERSLRQIGAGDPWTIYHARAEQMGREKQHREQYDFVTARAVARLATLLEYSLPLVRIGGVFCAMKGKVEEEQKEAERAAKLLGAELEKIDRFVLPGTGQDRSILIYRKVSPSPGKYPRSNAQIKKNPL